MDVQKIMEVINDVDNKSNKDLMTVKTELEEEFDKTKELILNLTRHLESIEMIYEKVNNELSKRFKK